MDEQRGPAGRPSKTKIVATVGPACDGVEALTELLRAGADAFRINTAHGDAAEHARRLDEIRRAGEAAGQPVGVLVDLAGPKIRLGELPGGVYDCRQGEQVLLGPPDASPDDGVLPTTYPPLVAELAPGDRVLLADGTVGLRVRAKRPGAVVCEVVQGGVVRSRQGVNLPGARLSAPALGERDLERACWAMDAGADFLGLSFVRSAEEVRRLKKLAAERGAETQVVAKIEKGEALEALEDIVDAADAVMVARGDLGVEIDIAQVPLAQKRIIACCHRRRKPVIIATQMLDSMQHSRLPTRAEASDVANAVLDGADACMLSGETAVGRYPRESVETMHRIALAVEGLRRRRRGPDLPPLDGPVSPVTEAVVHAAGRLADHLQARLIIVATATGRTALALSKDRNAALTVGVSHSPAVLRRMCLYWGVIPLAGAPAGDDVRLLEHVAAWGRRAGILEAGDRVVLLSGAGLPSSRHNLILVYELA